LNIILAGSGMAGKSRALQFIKRCLPTGTGDMVTHITDHAFNVDRNLDDILLIYEEMQNKYFGYDSSAGNKNNNSGGGTGGVSTGSDKDTTNFFKARLTSGRTTVYAYCENEDTKKRDIKVSHSSCQGNMFGASNNAFDTADLNVLSRLILYSVAKSKFDVEGLRPSDRNKTQMGGDPQHNKEIFEQQKEISRILILLEKAIQSNVLGENVYGTTMDMAIYAINEILDILQNRYGIQTNDVRKREYVYELARLMANYQAIWQGLTSVLTRDLQKDPLDPTRDIGFNPIVFLYGILPFLVATKDHVIDALTSLSSLWYHDYLELILSTFAIKKCDLVNLRKQDFLVRRKNEIAFSMNNMKKKMGDATLRGSSRRNNNNNRKQQKQKDNESINNNNEDNMVVGDESDETFIDYNYIRLRGANHKKIAYTISVAIASEYDKIVDENDILKLLKDHSRSNPIYDGYIPEFDEHGKLKKLVLSRDPANVIPRPVVEITYCQQTGLPMISVLIQFLKQKLSNWLKDDIIEPPDKVAINETDMLDQLERDIAVMMSSDSNDDESSTVNDDDDDDNGEMVIEKETTTQKKARLYSDIGEINKKTESLITKAIKDFYENDLLENYNNPAYKELMDSYKNKSGRSPFFRYITADPPKSVKLTDFEPQFAPVIHTTKTGDKDISFHDKLLMLPLEPKKNGKKLLVSNYNTIDPSVRDSLSIYNDNSITLVKKRTRNYLETDTWVIDCDLDVIACKEHMRRIGKRTLPGKEKYALINYPPSTMMAIFEHMTTEKISALREYPDADIETRINQRKRKIENQLSPETAIYPSFSEFVSSNHQHKDNDLSFIGNPLKRARIDITR
jgi:hypothetical protein